MSSAERMAAGLAARALGTTAWLTDLLPPRVRYGYVHRVTAAARPRELPSLGPLPPADPAAAPSGALRPGAADDPLAPVCVLVADALDVGGIGTIVEVLARGLATTGVRPVVLCPADGERLARLRRGGIETHVARDEDSARAVLSRLSPDAVQLHGAPAHLERAAMAGAAPLVPVLHNTEIHRSRSGWARFSALLERSSAAVAVSGTVRAFHASRCAPQLRERIVVVPNDVPPSPRAPSREAARTALGDLVGADLADDVVFVTLGRHDAQKNVAGTVASFLRAFEGAAAEQAHGGRPRLVFAGAPSDAVEYRRADALRRASAHGDRVHLLGPSDAPALLAAADAFLLDSFFEGWPVAATEAAAAGLPLVLADVGGAAELVAGDPGRSVLVPNAVGDPAAVSDRAVRVARRHARRQRNAAALAMAVRTVAERVTAERTGALRPVAPSVPSAHPVRMTETTHTRLRNASFSSSEPSRADGLGRSGAEPMVEAHARILTRAASSGTFLPFE